MKKHKSCTNELTALQGMKDKDNTVEMIEAHQAKTNNNTNRKGRKSAMERGLRISGEIAAIIAAIIAAYLVYLSWHADQEKMQIEQLIHSEAEAVVNGDLPRAIAIYTENASIENMGNPRDQWHGKDEIKQRYQSIINGQHFSKLKHYGIKVEINNDGEANVTASTEGFYKEGDKQAYIRSVDGEQWSFEKIDGEWKVDRFIYGIK